MKIEEAIMARHVRASTVVSAVLIVLMRLDANHDAKGQGNPIRIVTGLRATSQSLGWIGTEAGIFKVTGLKSDSRKWRPRVRRQPQGSSGVTGILLKLEPPRSSRVFWMAMTL